MYYPNELYHHGILGQRKGVRNGPPYPLSRSRMSKREKKLAKASPQTQKPRTKEDILKDPTTKELQSIKLEITNKELEDALKRIELDKKLSDLTRKETKTGFDIIDSFMKKLGKVNTWAETGLKSHELIGRILKELEKAGLITSDQKSKK